MSDNRNEESKRKSYLLRGILEHDPMQSAISEPDESQRSQNSPSGNCATRQSVTPDRSPSPLPDLIIEVVPRRHITSDDESEEFYQKLEEEIKELYRRDYLNHSSSSSDSSDGDNRADSHREQKSQSIEEDESFPDFDGECDLEKSINSENDTIARDHLNISKTIDELSTETSTSTSSVGSARMIRTTEIIKKRKYSSDDQDDYTQISKVSKKNSAEAEESPDVDETRDDGQSIELAENDDARSSNETV